MPSGLRPIPASLRPEDRGNRKALVLRSGPSSARLPGHSMTPRATLPAFAQRLQPKPRRAAPFRARPFPAFPQGSKGSGRGGAKFLSEATASPAGKKGLGGPGGCRPKSSGFPLAVPPEAQKSQASGCGRSNLRDWSQFITGWASESRDDLGKIPQLHLFCSGVY